MYTFIYLYCSLEILEAHFIPYYSTYRLGIILAVYFSRLLKKLTMMGAAMKLDKNKTYIWYIVILSATIGLPMTASFPQFTMVVTELSAKIGVSESFLLFTDTIRSFSIMLGMLISGPVYKKLGLKMTFLLSILLMVVPQVLMPLTQNAISLLILKIIQGLCSISFPVFLITIIAWTDKHTVGSTTAFFNGLFYGGAGIGATLVGTTISLSNWTNSFYLLACIIVVPSIIWLMTVKEKPHSNHGSSFPEKDSISTMKEVTTSKESWLLILCFISTIWMVQVLSVDLPLYAKEFHDNPSLIGLIMSSLSIGIFTACIISGKISDWSAKKINNPAVARLVTYSISPFLTIFSIVLILIIDKSNFIVFYVAILIVSFFSSWGLGSFYSILPEIMTRNQVTYSTGFIGGIADIGMPIGPLIFGVLLGANGLWDLAWITCILISLISLVCCLIMINDQFKV